MKKEITSPCPREELGDPPKINGVKLKPRPFTVTVQPNESFCNMMMWMKIRLRILKRKAKEREEFLRRMRAK